MIDRFVPSALAIRLVVYVISNESVTPARNSFYFLSVYSFASFMMD